MWHIIAVLIIVCHAKIMPLEMWLLLKGEAYDYLYHINCVSIRSLIYLIEEG